MTVFFTIVKTLCVLGMLKDFNIRTFFIASLLSRCKFQNEKVQIIANGLRTFLELVSIKSFEFKATMF